MGRELWTSPVTGHRRAGTRFVELRTILGSGVTARAICERLRSCPVDASATDMAKLLEERDFDVAGVQERRDTSVIGYVEREHLQRGGTVGEHMQPLGAERLISEATPVFGLLHVLKDRRYAFVLIGDAVTGLVTQWDLNKPPVRVYLFGLLSLLEMHLDYWARKDYPNDGWRAALKVERITQASTLLAERRRRNGGVTLFECLQFCDKRDLVVRRKERREVLGLGGKKAAESLLKQAEDLRNNLAHSQQELAGGTSWQAVIGLAESIETLLHRSDELVQAEAMQAAIGAQDDLWMPA